MATTQDYTTISPAAQASTASYVIVAGSLVNTAARHTLSYTIKNTGAESIDWKVVGGNLSDPSDGVIVNNVATITAGAYGTAYNATSLPYQWYAVYIVDTVAASHGEATLAAIAKK